MAADPGLMAQGGGPVAREGGGGAGTVLAAGLLSTALTLAGVWALVSFADVNIMGWYADYVLPVGAGLVGMAAGSGYGIASWVTGFRIQKGLLYTILALQLGGYFTGQYLEFRAITDGLDLVNDAGEALGFIDYYEFSATNFAWEENGKAGAPIGNWGYLFVGLGVAAFAFGGLAIPAVMMKKPYCERCARYMRTRSLALAPASAPDRKVKKGDTAGQAALDAENTAAITEVNALLQRLRELASRGDGYGIQGLLTAHPPSGSEARRVNKLPARLLIHLTRCRECASGYLSPALHAGHGKRIRITPLASILLPPEASRVLSA